MPGMNADDLTPDQCTKISADLYPGMNYLSRLKTAWSGAASGPTIRSIGSLRMPMMQSTG